MKILHISEVVNPAWQYGGLASSVFNLCKELVRQGNNVTIYSTDALDNKNRQKEKFVNSCGIEISYFRNLSNNLAWHRFFIPAGMVLEISKEIKKFDIVHLHSYRFLPNIIIPYYCHKYDIPYILQLHNGFDDFNRKVKLKKIYDQLVGYKLLKNADILIAELFTEARQYEKLGIDTSRIITLPNGVDLSDFRCEIRKGEFRKKYGLNDNVKIVLYLGRIDRVKGADLLINAFAGLTEKLNNVVLVIAGPDAGFLSEVKKLVKEKNIEKEVIFTGPIIGKDKFAAFIDADVYVMPSLNEGFSIAPLEAYACGVPVIATDHCGTIQWMQKYFDRIIQYDVKQLEETLVEILNISNIGNYVNKKEHNLKLIEEKFSWEAITKEVINIYYKILDPEIN